MAHVPQTLDRDLFELYLNDHLAGATAGRSRARRMATSYADLPIHDGLVRFADDLDQEHHRLRRLIEDLGLSHKTCRLVAAKIGEELGRFKLNGRFVTRSPLTPLLELELLRGAVNAKAGLYQELEALAPRLGIDPQEWADLAETAKEQSALLEDLHAQLRVTAFDRSDPDN